jgi:hypothetical protein
MQTLGACTSLIKCIPQASPTLSRILIFPLGKLLVARRNVCSKPAYLHRIEKPILLYRYLHTLAAHLPRNFDTLPHNCLCTVHSLPMLMRPQKTKTKTKSI